MRNAAWPSWREFFYKILILKVSVNVKGAIHYQLNGAILLCEVRPDGKKLSELRSFDRQ